MKKLFLLLSCALSLFSLQAQSRFTMFLNEKGEIFYLPGSYSTYKLSIPDQQYKYSYTPIASPKLDMSVPDYNPELSITTGDRPMDMQILSGAYEPYFNPYTRMLSRVSPTAFDFLESYNYQVNDRLSAGVIGLQSSWPGAGSINLVTTYTGWQMNNIKLWGGVYGGRYATPYDRSPGVMTGFTGGIDVQTTEWMKVKLWGSHVIYDQKGRDNMFLYLNHFHNKSSVGGAMEFKVSENFGFGVGIQHNYNPMRGKWEQNKLFYPTFRGKTGIHISVN